MRGCILSGGESIARLSHGIGCGGHGSCLSIELIQAFSGADPLAARSSRVPSCNAKCGDTRFSIRGLPHVTLCCASARSVTTDFIAVPPGRDTSGRRRAIRGTGVSGQTDRVSTIVAMGNVAGSRTGRIDAEMTAEITAGTGADTSGVLSGMGKARFGCGPL